MRERPLPADVIDVLVEFPLLEKRRGRGEEEEKVLVLVSPLPFCPIIYNPVCQLPGFVDGSRSETVLPRFKLQTLTVQEKVAHCKP